MKQNTIGVHTPKLTIKTLGKLEQLFPQLTFADTSWHNDACDSIEIDSIKTKTVNGNGVMVDTNKYRIWMPNVGEGEDYSDYVLTEFIDDHTEDKETVCKTFPVLVREITKQIIK